MYCQFFGFFERPFKLVPNPAYLYLSACHENALGHLLYAVRHGEGFVAITGEAGTGKTTLCRMFLESLDGATEAAYIFNPKLDSIQLLKSINEEFGLPSSAETTKELIDILNGFLMAKRIEKKQVILLIDEAQNLSKDVLEQIRLLSNLEMSANKLIQIFLIGQPELAEMLSSYELRQLAQRITLECQLRPFNFAETKAYIHHRITVAAQGTKVIFTDPAIFAVYRHSGGIPRLINVACDRALLTAFTEYKLTVTRRIVRKAISEIPGRRRGLRTWFFRKHSKEIVLVCFLYLLLIVLIIFPPIFPNSISEERPPANPKPVTGNKINPLPIPAVSDAKSEERQNKSQQEDTFFPIQHMSEAAKSAPGGIAPATDVPVSTSEPANQAQKPVEIHPDRLAVLLSRMDSRGSRYAAVTAAMQQWNESVYMARNLDAIEDDLEFFRLAATQNGLQILRTTVGWDTLQKVNLPVILELAAVPGNPCYFPLIGIGEEGLCFKLKDELLTVPLADVDKYWNGVAHIAWKDFYHYNGVIPTNASKDAVLNLKMHLNDIGFAKIEINPRYDDATREAVLQMQKKYGLSEDGVVGPFTQIVLYKELKNLHIPHLFSPS